MLLALDQTEGEERPASAASILGGPGAPSLTFHAEVESLAINQVDQLVSAVIELRILLDVDRSGGDQRHRLTCWDS